MTLPAQEEVTALVQRLLDHNMTRTEIAEAIGNRASPRTIYRWGAGHARPRNQATFEALRRLADEKDAEVDRRSGVEPQQ